jgi:hypothetical protein
MFARLDEHNFAKYVILLCFCVFVLPEAKGFSQKLLGRLKQAAGAASALRVKLMGALTKPAVNETAASFRAQHLEGRGPLRRGDRGGGLGF